MNYKIKSIGLGNWPIANYFHDQTICGNLTNHNKSFSVVSISVFHQIIVVNVVMYTVYFLDKIQKSGPLWNTDAEGSKRNV